MDDEQPGVPEWVVTYGDMMSLLLTFFIMLVSLSEVVATQKYRAVLDSLQNYMGYSSGPLAPPGKNFPLNSLVSRLETLGSFSEESGFGGVRKPSPEGRELKVYRTPEGVSVPVEPLIPFAAGSDRLPTDARERLSLIADVLAGKPNKIEIRAHAGSPSVADHESRRKLLDLTYRRGRAVMEVLVTLGVERQRMRITSAGDSEPLPDTGDEQAPVHDRVAIHMLDTMTETYIGPAGMPQ